MQQISVLHQTDSSTPSMDYKKNFMFQPWTVHKAGFCFSFSLPSIHLLFSGISTGKEFEVLSSKCILIVFKVKTEFDTSLRMKVRLIGLPCLFMASLNAYAIWHCGFHFVLQIFITWMLFSEVWVCACVFIAGSITVSLIINIIDTCNCTLILCVLVSKISYSLKWFFFSLQHSDYGQ